MILFLLSLRRERNYLRDIKMQSHLHNDRIYGIPIFVRRFCERGTQFGEIDWKN